MSRYELLQQDECVTCGETGCGNHCNYKEKDKNGNLTFVCGKDIESVHNGKIWFSMKNPENKYRSNSDGTPHIRCKFWDRSNYQQIVEAAIKEHDIVCWPVEEWKEYCKSFKESPE